MQLWYLFISFLITSVNNNFFILFSLSFFFKLPIIILLLFIFFKHKIFLSLVDFFVIPKSLIVGLNVVHPPLFYLSFFFGLLKFKNSLFSVKFFNIWMISSFTLLLGGFWGLGNSVWGFFWVNDLIEQVLLSYTLLLLGMLHFYMRNNSVVFYFYTIFIIFIFLLLSRWGFVFTRHSFFNINNTYNIYLSYYFLVNITYSKIFTNFIIFFLPPYLHISIYIYITIFLVNFLSKISLYNLKFIILHILIFVIYITWIKVRCHNYNYVGVYLTYVCNVYLYSWFYIYNNYILTFFKIFIVQWLNIVGYHVYSFKFILFYFIRASYNFFFYITLISIIKIYKNYLQK